jgi:hypothetical protein
MVKTRDFDLDLDGRSLWVLCVLPPTKAQGSSITYRSWLAELEVVVFVDLGEERASNI